ncbi:hypothetical protein I316_07365 [Kwoniella heveanensis BCC8398]|uniref:Solute carrier family 39 (Zinc transporter), member 1/2/3 n=1 Tax=Kwoniella heveanensis BCC8398 TaxID=1296120 RepID=A0A1B9GIU8_9TREE|nr:hypothetical protein I316_07365 [Kwoniella heveanensis BCC8398]
MPAKLLVIASLGLSVFGSLVTAGAEEVEMTKADTDVNTDTCAPSSPESYNLGLHVASVFVLLVASGIGVFGPVLLGSDRGFDGRSLMYRYTFFALKHFGTGIIVSLAFCHLLQDAFETFSNECIGELAFEPTAPAIAMGSMLVIWLIDYSSARWAASRDQNKMSNDAIASTTTDPLSTPGSDTKPVLQDLCCETGCRPLKEWDPASRRALWDVQLLEGGIVFHSIMIGVALGAQVDGFSATFAALVFHQLFEGLGLGARIGALRWSDQFGSAWKKWLMCLAYTVITPIGIVIGIGVHESFNENGRAELLAIGVLNSISAGILLYSGLCQLLYSEWVVGDMRDTSNRRVIVAIVSLALGLFAMSIIGKWT